MKFKGSKKIVSLFLAVLMVVTSVPAFAINASAAVNTSTDVSALEKAMTDYETKMKNGGIMTNMKVAYDAYVNAQKAIDAVKYGYSTSIDVSAVAANLTNATNNMNSWTSYKGTMRSKFSGDKDYLDDYYYNITYQNILYADETASSAGEQKIQTWHDWGNRYNYTTGKFTYASVVMLYDDKTAPQTGVMFTSLPTATGGAISKSAKEYAAWMSANNGGLKLTLNKWKGWDTKDNFQYIVNGCSDTLSTSDTTSYNTSNHAEDVRYGNYISFDATNDSFADGTLVKTYTPTWSFYVSNKDQSAKKGEISTSKTIQIFNYKAVIDAIDSTKSTIANVANYKQGGLSTLFSDIESLMEDPNSFFTDSNGKRTNGINECSSYYRDAITNTKSHLNSVTADNKNYNDLRTAIADAETAPTTKTAKSLVAYGKAISEARNVFSNDVLKNGYNSPDNAETKATALNDAKSALADAYSDSTKDNFDAAVTVVKAMDMDALTADGQAYIQNLIDTSTAKLTTTISDSDKTYYALATGQSVDTAKNITDSAVDELTKALLTFAASPDESYINHYNVTFAAQIEKNDVTTDLTAKTFNNQAYGTMITFDADSFSEISALENKSIKWTVQYTYADGSTKSQKIQSVGNSITLKATANMTVTAIVADETADETVTNYTVKFYNIYNNVVDFTYITEDQLPEAKEYTGSQITIGDYTYTPDVPFYTLSGFKVSAPNANKVISVFPTYSATPTVDVTVYMGTATSKYMTGDAVVTAKTVFLDTSVDNFYAWAVQINGKYQIVAYNKDYAFAAITGATYTPIIKENGVYKVYTDNNSTLKNLTADDVYQFNNNTQYKLTDNDYLVAKLDTKAPFTYIETITTVNGKNRAYIRITANSSSVDSFGVFGNNSKKPLPAFNDVTGQYAVDMSKLPADFKAYVSYSVKYTDKDGNTYNIATTDYATNA